ncbi:hypothetical protein GIB67_010255, partial [Kingdonia uniflora]
YLCLRCFIRIDFILFEYIYETGYVRTEARFTIFPLGVGCIFEGCFCLEMRSFSILSSLVYKGELGYFFSRLDLERSSKEEA